MTLNGRDRLVVQAVARFGQLSSFQIRSMIFAGIASATPADRTLRRLTERNYLSRIERRIVGGAKGGSGQYVYQLGRNGHAEYKQGRYMPVRTVNFHSLAIADSYIALLEQQRAGRLRLVGSSAEPDCWATIGSHELKPDMFVDFEHARSRQRIKLWLEVDMGTEGQRQIKEKLQRYWSAYSVADPDEWPEFPLVVFIAVDNYRANELRWIIERGPTEAQPLFRVCTLPEFIHSFQ